MKKKWFRVFSDFFILKPYTYMLDFMAWTIVPCHEKWKPPKASNDNSRIRSV